MCAFISGENVADLSGLKAAIRTYEKIVERFVSLCYLKVGSFKLGVLKQVG